MARQLTRTRDLLYALLTPLVRAWLASTWWTWRGGQVIGEAHLQTVLDAGGPIIPCYWHEMHFMGVRMMLQLQRRGLKLGFLISPSVDGEVPARLARGWGAEAIRGSTTRTGAKAMRELYLKVTRDGVSPVTTSDGPQGPRREFKPGAIMLAQMTGAPIVLVACAASRAWRLRTWDRFVIPKPFARIACAVSAPRYVPRELKVDDLQPVQREIEATMAALVEQAEAAVGPHR